MTTKGLNNYILALQLPSSFKFSSSNTRLSWKNWHVPLPNHVCSALESLLRHEASWINTVHFSELFMLPRKLPVPQQRRLCCTPHIRRRGGCIVAPLLDNAYMIRSMAAATLCGWDAREHVRDAWVSSHLLSEKLLRARDNRGRGSASPAKSNVAYYIHG
jgi:hypothetical protein